MSFSISGKTAIVTGAANGVGLAIARHFLDVGANVMFADMDEERLSDEAGGDREEGSARYFVGDLRQRLTTANLLSATIDAFDRVDILVNASRQVLPSDPLNIEDTSVETMFEQNVVASLRLSQLVGNRMIKQSKGRPEDEPVGSIVNLSSIAADRTHAKLLAYSIGSAALNQMTRSLAVAMAQHRIRVNALAIGSVMSESLKKRLKDGGSDLRNDIINSTPLGRIAPASEVAEAAQFLASDGAAFMTGEVITLDGGRTLLDSVAHSAH